MKMERQNNITSEALYRRNMAVFRIAKIAQSLIFLSPIWVAYERQFLSFSQLTAIEASIMAIQILFDLPTGVIADMFGRRIAIMAGLFLWGTAEIVYSGSSTFQGFLVYAILFGIGNSFSSGAWESLLYDTVKEAGKEHMFPIEHARQSMIFQFGYALACLVGGVIGNISYLYAIWATATTWYIGSVVAFFFIEPHIDSVRYTVSDYTNRLKIGMKELVKNKHVASISLFYILVGALTWTCQYSFTAMLLTQLGYTPTEFGYSIAILRIVCGVTLFQFAKYLHVFNRSSVFLFFAFVLLIGFLPGVLFTKWTALPFIGILMFSSAARWSILGKYVNAEYSSETRATALSALSTSINIIYIIIMFASGPIIERYGGVKTVFTLLGIIAAVTVFPVGIRLAFTHKGRGA